jgi:glycosyltransferase involved in cell wall biosynthesis
MISVCILTKNSSATLEKTLKSVCSFSEVLILDNGSTDDTLLIAASFANVQIRHSPFIGFGNLRNQAAKFAKYDWILALDSDEELSFSLLEEFKNLSLQNDYVYSISRHNFYNGKRIRGCGWDPDRVVRLYNRQQTQYDEADVHEAVLVKHLQKIALCHPIFHTPYRSTEEFLSKMQHYSSLFAQQNVGKKRSSFLKALAKGSFSFFRSYFLQKGLFLGKEGFLISLYNANTTFYKYLKLAEKSSSFS